MFPDSLKQLKPIHIFLGMLLFVFLSYAIIHFIDKPHIVTSFANTTLSVLAPFIYAFLLAYILSPCVNFFESAFNFKRGFAILTTYLALASFLVILSYIIIPSIAESLASLLKSVPMYLSQLEDFVVHLLNSLNINSSLDFLELINTKILDALPSIGNYITEYINSAISTTVSVFKTVFNLFIALVACFYILLEKEVFIDWAQKIVYILLNPINGSKFISVLTLLNENIGRYLLGKSINSCIIAIGSFIGLSVVHAKYSLLLSIGFGLFNMIPFVGPILATIIAVTLNLFHNVAIAIIVLVIMFTLQQVESFVLEPKLIGKKMGLNPFLTLFAVSIGGSLFGAIGMILGVPVTSIIKNTFKPILLNHPHLSTVDLSKNNAM